MSVTETNIYSNIYKDTTKRLNGLWHLLLIWKGSVFKLIWHDVLLFIVCYALLSILYRTVLFENPRHREMFELICVYAGRFSNLIPISFLTGFYVSQVVSRWWDQFMSLPWPDAIAFKLVGFCPGKDRFRRNLRRTVMRYINLSTILVYRMVSLRVKARFPDYDSLVGAKLMLPHEVKRLRRVHERTPHESTWTPILWAVELIQRARTEAKISIEAPVYASLICSIDYIDSCNRKILNYGWVNFPLAYTQVASVSVFTYFVAALFGRQYLIPREEGLDSEMFPHINVTYASEKPFDFHTPDFYVPFFTFVELLSYMGWIKVAETLLNPFGDDDEDFQVNYMIDRNLQVSYLIVDETEDEMDMIEDPFMDDDNNIPTELPAYVNKSSKGLPLSRHTSNTSSSPFTAKKPALLDKLRDSLRIKTNARSFEPQSEEAEGKDNTGFENQEDLANTLYLTVNEAAKGMDNKSESNDNDISVILAEEDSKGIAREEALEPRVGEQEVRL